MKSKDWIEQARKTGIPPPDFLANLPLVGSQAHGAQTAALVLACGAGALYLAQSSFWAVSADVAGEYTGIVGGMMNMGGQIGGAVACGGDPDALISALKRQFNATAVPLSPQIAKVATILIAPRINARGVPEDDPRLLELADPIRD